MENKEQMVNEDVIVKSPFEAINDDNKQKRYYTHSVVSYANLEEITPLLKQGKHYAYILHDKDITDIHYHILITFQREKSFEWVRKQVTSSQNTFTQCVKGDIDDVLDYYRHEGQPTKARYKEEDIVYDDKEYWTKRRSTGDKEEHVNDLFVDDLLSADYSVEFMSRKYGRDFIKNWEKYESARSKMLTDRRRMNELTKEQEFKEEMERRLQIINAVQW